MAKTFKGTITFEEVVLHKVTFLMEAESEEDALNILATVSDSEMANLYPGMLRSRVIHHVFSEEDVVGRTVATDYQLREV